MSNGQALFAHCSTNLHYIVRRWPFSTAHLVDADVSIDFAKYTTPEDRVAVIATAPLTDNEVWTAFKPGDLLMFLNAGSSRENPSRDRTSGSRKNPPSCRPRR
jgi:predicted glutamine amidotransferase